MRRPGVSMFRSVARLPPHTSMHCIRSVLAVLNGCSGLVFGFWMSRPVASKYQWHLNTCRDRDASLYVYMVAGWRLVSAIQSDAAQNDAGVGVRSAAQLNRSRQPINLYQLSMQVAVIGSGISGNLAARVLSAEHQVDVFESSSHVGGHAQTVETHAYGRDVPVDVAFMVLNRRTYPNFCRMLELLGVQTQDSEMSLSVRCWRTGLEYQGSSLNGLFAQRRNLVRRSFYRMLRDIIRFNRRATEFCESGDEQTSLGEFLHGIGVGPEFRDQYFVPMSAAIWSADPEALDRFPAKFILGFCRNHGLLQLTDRPQWLTIANRSRDYVTRLMRPIRDRIFLNSPVREVRRVGGGVRLSLDERDVQYDHVVFASHADQTLRMLKDASPVEQEILSGFPYQRNMAVLHTDTSVLPQRRRAWASWNYHVSRQPSNQASVTYDLNRLQSLGLPGPLCLTLNPHCEIDDQKVLQRFEFQHPVFSDQSIASQGRFDEINGRNGVSFCGAYWGYGFHEDGVNSALAVTRTFGLDLDVLANPPLAESQPTRQLVGV